MTSILQEENNKLEGIKSDFITVASHQLRTPISAIRWSLDTLLDGKLGKLSDKQVEVIKEAYRNNKFMVKVVNDLLRVARLEEKGIQLGPKFVDVSKIVQEVAKRHQVFAKAFNCQIQILADKQLPKAYFDPGQLKMIIDALLDNAIRYGKQAGKIKISFQKTENYLTIKIQDNGIGIPDNQKNLIFSKFFRGSNAVKVQTEGLGLALYVAKMIVEASGGKIFFFSRENIGTTFHISLPLNKNRTELNESLPLTEAEARATLKKEREFVAITIHELKAPLGVSKWSLEMLKNQKPGKLNSEQLNLIEQVYRGNERLLVLVRDLLNLAKIQEGKFEVEPKLIQLDQIADEVIKGFVLTAGQKKIKINFDKPKGLPKVFADPNRIAQVITNIVSNAIKYTPGNGQVDVAIKKYSGAQLKQLDRQSEIVSLNFTGNKKGYLVVAVKDTGIGISAQDQKKMFTRFFRSKQVLKSEAEGTGLGLYITKSIVNLHQGDIWFTSRPGQGSIFYFSLPIA